MTAHGFSILGDSAFVNKRKMERARKKNGRNNIIIAEALEAIAITAAFYVQRETIGGMESTEN